MRIVVHGQEAFGKAVLEKLLERKENVVAVFCAPDKAGRPEDPLKIFAREKGLPVHQPKSWKVPEALELMKSTNADLCVMAYVTLFVPQPVIDAPKLGTIQYHPSLLPLHRGPSSINWPIAWGSKQTGLSAGIAYYHRKGHWKEPPNLLNPYWRATIVPLTVDAQGRGGDVADTLNDVGAGWAASAWNGLRGQGYEGGP